MVEVLWICPSGTEVEAFVFQWLCRRRQEPCGRCFLGKDAVAQVLRSNSAMLQGASTIVVFWVELAVVFMPRRRLAVAKVQTCWFLA